ncbi:MAG: Rv1355c family protein [Leucothrix sp.]
MQQPTAQDVFLNSGFYGVGTHNYVPFRQGSIDVKLPVPNADMRLFIFHPADYPYLWAKYLEGLQREYSRIGVDHILDMKTLNNPESAVMAVLVIIDGEVVSGIRFHSPLRKVSNASVYQEMAMGDQELLKQHLQSWIPEKAIEAKGLWLDVRHPSRKRILQSITRSIIYGAALYGARYIPCTSPASMTKVYIEAGMEILEEVGCVPYPSEDFKTTLGIFDLQKVFDRCSDKNRVLLRRDWQQIQHARSQSQQHRNNDDRWLPTILDEANPFHAQALESLLMDNDYTQKANFSSMKNELGEIIPPVSEDLQNESKRWVAYPWRKTALETVGPRSFKRLLNDRNRNKITDDEQNKLSELAIGVVGLSTGHVIAHTMVMEGVCGHIKLADFDTLEVSNLNRIPASLLDIGSNKAVITARKIAELDPYLNIDVFEDGLHESNIDRFMNGLDIIVEECDSLDVKVLVREAAIKRKIPVLMSTSDMGMMDVERFDIDDNPKPFHGLTDVKASDLKDLSRRDKSGYALAIIDGERVSARLAASMVEIDYTVSTWAQLASDVTQGAALVTTAVRRIGTEKPTPSSRTRMNMDEVLERGELPSKPKIPSEKSAIEPVFSGELNEDMLFAAKYAPSPGNIQPWKISWVNEKLNLEIDRSLTTSMDIKWRGAMVALGAATLNAEIVAMHHNISYDVEYFPLKRKPDLVARLSLCKAGKLDERVKKFYPYLLSRKTNREISQRQIVSLETLERLSSVTEHYPVKLHMLSNLSELQDYAKISIESDRLRHISKHLHNEMMGELVWPGRDSLEQGIDVRTLGLAPKDLNVLSILERTDVMEELANWDAGQALGDYNRDRILSSSAMVVLTIKGKSDLDYVVGGKALQHFWLDAELNGLSVQPISPIFLYSTNDDEAHELMGEEYYQEVVELQQCFNKLLGIAENDYAVLALRLSFATDLEFRSLRKK